MDFFRKLFGQPGDSTQDPNYSEDLHSIEARLAHLPVEKAKLLSAFALLLARVARADQNVSEGEVSRMREVLVKHCHLDSDQAALVVELALQRALLHSVEEHIVLRQLNALATREQKAEMLRGLLHVACESDISELESEEIFGIAKAMLFSRQEYLAIRNEFRDHLAILK